VATCGYFRRVGGKCRQCHSRHRKPVPGCDTNHTSHFSWNRAIGLVALRHGQNDGNRSWQFSVICEARQQLRCVSNRIVTSSGIRKLWSFQHDQHDVGARKESARSTNSMGAANAKSVAVIAERACPNSRDLLLYSHHKTSSSSRSIAEARSSVSKADLRTGFSVPHNAAASPDGDNSSSLAES
jgi:hypothetical protein